MRGEYFITRPGQYAEVYHKGRTRADKLVVVKLAPNGLPLSRYGLSVSRRVGKAVVRNRIKRVLREVMRPVALLPGWDIVLIARPAIAVADYMAVKGSVLGLLGQARLLGGDDEDTGTGIN